jgi:hypothetical protein
MKTSKREFRIVWLGAAAALLLGTGCASTTPKDAAAPAPAPVAATATAINPTPMPAAQMPAAAMALTGAQEVPPNSSTASGKSTIMIGADKMITGSIEVMGMTPTMAHIHEAVQGVNGPVIVPFTKTGESTFVPAPGAKLTDAQYASYKAGKLYLNVHSAAFPGGEVRLQLWPAK